MSTKKYHTFVGEPLRNKPVTSLAGIGEDIGRRLVANGFDKAYVVLGQFLILKKNKGLFIDWIKDTAGANNKQANDCYTALREWCNRFGAADPHNKKRTMSSPDLNNNRDPKAKKPKLQNKQDTKKIWGAKSVSPEVKEGPKVTSIPRAQPTMMTKVPSTAFNLPKPANAPIASTSSAAKQPQQYHSVKPAPQQKVQIIRSSDGKMQVQGLLPCQQVVQMRDGKLAIMTTPKPPVVPTVTNPPQQQKQPQVVAQQVAPGAPIPPAQVPFISGGKTYTIPYSMLPYLGASALVPGAPIPPDRVAILFQGKNYTIPKSVLPTNTKSPMKTPPTELPKNNKDEDVKPFICTSCKKLFNEKACQTM